MFSKKHKITEDFKKIGYYAVVSDNTITLYDELKDCVRTSMPYAATLEVAEDGYVLNGKHIAVTDDIRKMIEEYHATLKYKPYTYNPIYNEKSRIEFRITDYVEDLGFKTEFDTTHMCYTLKFGTNNIYGAETISMHVMFDNENACGKEPTGIITRPVSYGKWIQKRFKNTEEAIAAINSLLKPELICTAASFLEMLKKSSDDINLDDMQEATLNSSFQIQYRKMKDELIDTLKKTLASLEGNDKKTAP